MPTEYNKLKHDCARLGLSAKGTKQVLSERLDRFSRGDTEQKIFTGETDNKDISPEEIIVDNPTKPQDQIVAPNEDEHAKIAWEAQWEKIKARLELILAGRAQYFLQENAPGNYSVVFKGGARQSECVNVSAGINTIAKIAATFVSPAIIAPRTGGDTPEMAMKRFEENNPMRT